MIFIKLNAANLLTHQCELSQRNAVARAAPSLLRKIPQEVLDRLPQDIQRLIESRKVYHSLNVLQTYRESHVAMNCDNNTR